MDQLDLMLTTQTRVEDARSKARSLGMTFAVDRVGHQSGSVILVTSTEPSTKDSMSFASRMTQA